MFPNPNRRRGKRSPAGGKSWLDSLLEYIQAQKALPPINELGLNPAISGQFSNLQLFRPRDWSDYANALGRSTEFGPTSGTWARPPYMTTRTAGTGGLGAQKTATLQKEKALSPADVAKQTGGGFTDQLSGYAAFDKWVRDMSKAGAPSGWYANQSGGGAPGYGVGYGGSLIPTKNFKPDTYLTQSLANAQAAIAGNEAGLDRLQYLGDRWFGRGGIYLQSGAKQGFGGLQGAHRGRSSKRWGTPSYTEVRKWDRQRKKKLRNSGNEPSAPEGEGLTSALRGGSAYWSL